MKLIPLFVFSLALALALSPAPAAGRAKAKRSPLLPEFPKPTGPAVPGRIYNTSLGGKDLRFFSDAIEYGLAEVFLAGLATAQAETDRVKALANVLSQTQREENSKLSRLAALKDLSLGDRDAAAEESLTKKFAKIPKEKFDATWIEEIVALHEKAVANYADASTSADGDIKAFAQKALPLAKEKLSLVNGGGGTKTPKFRTQNSQPQPR